METSLYTQKKLDGKKSNLTHTLTSVNSRRLNKLTAAACTDQRLVLLRITNGCGENKDRAPVQSSSDHTQEI